MQILTENNTCIMIDDIPQDAVSICYGVLDYHDPNDVDYFFMPLMFLETFTAPAAELSIGNYTITVPLDWVIAVGDKFMGEVEVLPVSSLNGREFYAYSYNPINGYRPDYLPVRINNIYPEKEWLFPQMKSGHMLVTPLTNQIIEVPRKEWGTNADYTIPTVPCALFAKDGAGLPEYLDVRVLF